MPSATAPKSSKARPNRRQQQSIVFVETYSDPVKESRSAKNKHLVKKWSMLNRKNDHTPTTTLSIDGKPVLITHRLDTSSASSASTSDEGKVLQQDSTFHTDEDESCYALIEKATASKFFPLVNDDPFNSLPVRTNRQVSELLYNYLSYHYVEDRPWFQPDDDYGSLLVAARKQTWFPVAKESGAAYASLLALITACSPFQSEMKGLKEHLLGYAYRLTNAELRSSRALANSTVLAVVMLTLIAQAMHDNRAFTSHTTGLQALLQTRKENPEETWACVKPERYPFEPLMASDSTTFTGDGFERLAEAGFISPASWSTFWKEACVFSSLVVLTPGDTFWWSAWAQHKWLVGIPESLGMTASDKVFHAALRLNWHLIVFQGTLLTSPVVRGMIVEIRTEMTKGDVEALLAYQPFAILWVALSAGPFALNLEGWFHKLLQAGIIAAGHPTFTDTVAVFQREFLWHSNRTHYAQKFWQEKNSEVVSMHACCKPNIAARPSEDEVEQDLAEALQALEFGGSYFRALETQNRKTRQCLCAWWV